MKNNGYIFTISTFFLMSSILVLAMFFSLRVGETDISGPKLAAIYDDIRGDVFGYLRVSTYVADYEIEYGNLTLVSFAEDLKVSGIEKQLREYEQFVESDNYSSLVYENINDRAGSQSGADISMNLVANKTLTMVPYNYVYSYDSFEKESITAYPLANNTNLLGVVINLTVDGNVTSIEQESEYGDIALRLIVHWRNITYDNTTNVSRNKLSNWVFNVPNGSVNITTGKLPIDGVNTSSSFSISLGGQANAYSNTTFIFGMLPHIVLESGFSITIKDILGNTRPGTKIIDYTRIKDNLWFLPKNISIGSLPLEITLEGPPDGGGIEEPVLLGFCVCEPCFYWESYFEGEIICEERPCPASCAIEENMTTWWI